MARLIELVIVGDVTLGHQSQEPAVGDGSGAVVELGVHARRQARDHEGIKVPRRLGKAGEAPLSRSKERVLPEQVLTAVARDAKLGQHDELGTVRPYGIRDLCDACLDVSIDIGDPHLWRTGCDLDKSVLHESSRR